VAHIAQWHKIYDSEAPHKQRFPGHWDKLEIYKNSKLMKKKIQIHPLYIF
jgi:hypothetical protein